MKTGQKRWKPVKKVRFLAKSFGGMEKKAVLSPCVITPLPVRTAHAEGAFIEQQFE